MKSFILALILILAQNVSAKRLPAPYCKDFSYKTKKKEIRLTTTCIEQVIGRQPGGRKSYFLTSTDVKEALAKALKTKGKVFKINGVAYTGFLDLKYEEGEPYSEQYKAKMYSFTFKDGVLETVNVRGNLRMETNK